MKKFEVRIPIQAYWVEIVEAHSDSEALACILPFSYLEQVQDIQADMLYASIIEVSEVDDEQ